MEKRYFSCSVFYCTFFLVFFWGAFFAQEDFPNGMVASERNYLTFSEENVQNLPYWKQFNSDAFESHPEFGKLPHDAPCSECVEVLEKRKENERYFININNPAEFYQQQSYGALHYMKNGQWITIDSRIRPQSTTIFAALNQFDGVGFNTQNKLSFIKTPFGSVSFNQWILVGLKDEQEQILAQANWSDFTAGDDGILIHNIFPGIDAEMNTLRGSIKTNFIVRELEFTGYDFILFRDKFEDSSQGKLSFEETPGLTESVGTVHYKNQTETLLEISPAIIYPRGGEKDEVSEASYRINNNYLDVAVPVNWITHYLQLYDELVIDPIVTSTNTLAQASITGSGYNATCFTGYCTYNLTVPTPANATVTDISWSFNYRATSPCFRSEGAITLYLGSCRSPGPANFYWFCNNPSAGDCNGSNISIFSDFNSCLPAPSCTPQNLNFSLRFHRCYSAGGGCSNACIGAISPWTMTVTGRTIEYQNTVNPITLSATTICQGQNITATTTSSFGVPPYNYNWSLNAGGAPSVGTGASTSINFPNSGTFTLYSIVTDACGNQVTSSRNITVNPGPTVTANPNPQTICSGQQVGVTLTSGTAGATFNWTVAQSGVSGASNGSGGTINHTLTNAGATPGTATYTVTATASGCTGNPITVPVTVNPTPNAIATPANATICSGQNANISLTSNVAGTTFSWTATASGASGQSAGSSATINQTLTATGSSAGTVTYTITPSANGCVGAPINVVITINPPPNVVANPTSQTICSGQSTSINLSSAVGGTTFNWTVNQSGVSGAANGSGTTINQTLSNVGTTSGTATYTITPSASGCLGSPINVLITVNPTPNVTATPASATICSGQNANVSLTSNVVGTTFSWTATASGASGQSAGSSATINQTLTATGSSAGTVTYTITPSANGCVGAPINVVITINPPPNVVANPTSQTICSGQSTSINLSSAVGGTTFNWTVNQSGVSGAANGSGTTINQTISTTGAGAGTATYTVTPSASGCSGTPSNITVTVNPTEDPTFNYNPSTICVSGSNPIPTVTTPGGTFSGAGVTFINTQTGEVDVSATPTGTYTINYTTSGPCSASSTQNLTITNAPAADFTYSGPYCLNDANPSPQLAPGANSGVYTSSNAGLVVNSNTGVINLASSQAGTYQVTNTIPAAGGCAQVAHIEDVTILAVPTATLSGGGEVCAGSPLPDLTISFTGQPDWTVDLSDGTNTIQLTSSTSPLTYTPPSTGNYSLISVSDANCTGTVSGSAQVQTTSPPVMNAVQDITQCHNQSVTVPNFTSSSGTATYTWTNSNTTIGLAGSGTGNIGTFTGTNNGASAVTATITVTPSIPGCAGDLITFTITINPLPTPTIGGAGVYCAGQPINILTGNPSSGGQLNWYSDAQLTNLIGTGNSHQPTNTVGSTTYYLTETTGTCVSTPVSAVVTVNPLPNINAGADQTNCEGQLITLNGTGGTSYSWDNGVVNGVPFTQNQGTVVYTVVGTDVNGCQNSDQVSVTVTSNPVPSFSVTNSSGCSPLEVTLTNTTAFPNPIGCSWNLGNGQTINGCGSVNPIYTSEGCYDVTLTVTYSAGCSNSFSIPNAVCVDENPVAGFIVSPTTVEINGQVDFINSSSNATDYVWEFGDDTGTSTEISPIYAYEDEGNYLVTLIAYSANGCTDTIQQLIVVNEELIFYVPNTFTPDGNKFNETFSPVFTSGFDIYGYNLLIFNRWGEIIFESENADIGWDGTYGGKLMQEGTYVWQIKVKVKGVDKPELHRGHVNLLR